MILRGGLFIQFHTVEYDMKRHWFSASRLCDVIRLRQNCFFRSLIDLFTLDAFEHSSVEMTDQKAENISSIPIDGFSNLRITSIWTFLMSVS